MLAKNLQGAALATQPAFIEDCFSSYLYTGTGSTQTITNGIDLSGKGGLVWTKSRTEAGRSHALFDTTRGINSLISSNLTSNFTVSPSGNAIASFGSSGYTLGSDSGNWGVNNSANGSLVSWTFRKQAKFFDVVTYTGNGSNRTISHNLGSVPGCIIVKRTDTTANWQVYHRSLANTEYIVLNSTAAKATGTTRWNSTTPTSTVFSLGTDSTVNANGGTYVAYLFAHDAGGFGASGSDNVISCGTYSVPASASNAPVINLGWEPQWLLIKSSSSAENWELFDNMRGLRTTTGATPVLVPNLSDAEASGGITYPTINPTGFQGVGTANTTYIYIAIRRGPMKTPTSGTSVFTPVTRTGTGAAATVTGVGFAPDVVLIDGRGTGYASNFQDKLRGPSKYLLTVNSDAEVSFITNTVTSFNMDGISLGVDGSNLVNESGVSYINYYFRRAPGFFDVVCYTGTSSARTVTHNLGAVPELMIVKSRSLGTPWWVYDAATGNTKYQPLNSTAIPSTNSSAWNNTTPTASVFTVGTNPNVNDLGNTYVAYLFATVPGVSKVGSYTGNGSNQTINCGFTGGARFILIKRTDSTGDWYVWDTARGIVSGNDPRLRLNSTDAESSDDSVDPNNSGFIVNQLSATNINVNAATYIFLAIA